MTTYTTNDRIKTRPWLDDEHIHVNGHALVYTKVQPGKKTDPEQLLVRLPGRRSATVAQLRERGNTVALPRALRTTDFL